ncbi:iron-sulfur cluster biosynthesis family protein [Domibacillus sp. A3M-37]|uniref:iron-sulfur cluster biosynthesis family protein n=1 Tax=Domibacillus sp. A3M-37 TaxID=2962037 RepID=UPI0020B8857E|nr:iron-sulfur cluster biosynthesis family protein [Domibacillus sp. A3M-37]MCP3762990.1 iron-sulfur cluster biosynthesis family protein [Domibacillus sp. A3M-37]
MNIDVKPAAAAELKKVEYKENEGVRIESIFIGSCSIASEYHLKIDQKKDNDDLFIVDDIPLLVSKVSQENLHEHISLDFNPAMGYKLTSAEETYRYNLKLERA